MYSKISREGSLLSLLVPSLNPGVGADSSEVLVEELTRLVLLALHNNIYFTKMKYLRKKNILKPPDITFSFWHLWKST